MMAEPITIDDVNDLHEQGFSIIPLGSPLELPPPYFIKRCSSLEEAKEKWPKTPRIPWKDYQKRTPTDKEIASWSKQWPQTNWGIVTGLSIVVIDGDSEEACKFLESGSLTVSPWKVKTAKGKHYYFQAPSDFVVKNSTDPNIKIDIRGVGGYVVAPGSIHHSGVVYEWEIDRLYDATAATDLPILSKNDLLAINDYNGQFVKRESSGNFSLINFNADKHLTHDGTPENEGGRNTAAASLAGQHITNGHSLNEIKGLLDTWNNTNNPPLSEPELNTTIASVVSTHNRNNPNDSVLIEREPVVLDSIKEAQPDEDFILKPTGVLGEFVDHYMASAPKPNMVLAIQSALAFGSVMAGRIFQTTSRNTSNLYFVSVGNSGIGKEHGKTLINNILAESNNAQLMGDDAYTSGQAVVSKLLESPTHITIIDEFGRHMEAQKKSDTSLAVEANSKLMEAFGAATGVLRAKSNSTMHLTERQREDLQNRVVYNPSLTLLGLTTPGRFYESLTNDLVRDGFLGRYLIATTKAERQPFKHREQPEIPTSIVDWAKKIRMPTEWTAGGGNINGFTANDASIKPNIIKVKLSKEAAKCFESFDIKMIQVQNDLEKEGLEELFARSNEIAMRLSLIICLSENPDNRTININHAEWAQKYVEAHHNEMLQAVRMHVSDSEYGQLIRLCINKIEKSGKHGASMRDLKRSISKLRGLKPRELKEVESSLNDHEDLVCEMVKGVRGPTGFRWFYVE